MLCRDCKHCKTFRVGCVSTRSYCNASKGSAIKGEKLGVRLDYNKVHPKCPLKINKEDKEKCKN